MRVVLIIVFITCIGCEPAVEQAAPAPPPVEQVQSVDQAPAAEAPAEPVTVSYTHLTLPTILLV